MQKPVEGKGARFGVGYLAGVPLASDQTSRSLRGAGSKEQPRKSQPVIVKMHTYPRVEGNAKLVIVSEKDVQCGSTIVKMIWECKWC